MANSHHEDDEHVEVVHPQVARDVVVTSEQVDELAARDDARALDHVAVGRLLELRSGQTAEQPARLRVGDSLQVVVLASLLATTQELRSVALEASADDLAFILRV